MLRESTETQHKDGRPRRWFYSDDFDLIVWLAADGTVDGFQLCYGKPEKEHAVNWNADEGLNHFAVDSGESAPGLKRAPVLTDEPAPPPADLAARFREQSAGIDAELRDFVLARLQGSRA